MPIDLITTPNAADANAFVDFEEYAYYHERRVPLDPPVTVAGDIAARNIITATRVLSSMITPRKTLRVDASGKHYYYTSRAWTGEIATADQALAWGRMGMFDRFGRAIPSDTIPQELKDATSELAGILGNEDKTLDNDIAVQGITRIKAGSVELDFKEIIESRILPDSVLNLMPSTWFTDEVITYISTSPPATKRKLIFEVA